MTGIRLKILFSFITIFGLVNGNQPVNPDEELNPLTLTWNQVHRMVRENLFEVNELKKENIAILGALRQCLGFESCLKSSNLFEHPNLLAGGELNNLDYGPGALIASLNRRLVTLEEYQNQLESEINERKIQVQRQRVENYRRYQEGLRQGQGQGQGQTSSSEHQQSQQQSGWSSRTQESERQSGSSSEHGTQSRGGWSSSSSSHDGRQSGSSSEHGGRDGWSSSSSGYVGRQSGSSSEHGTQSRGGWSSGSSYDDRQRGSSSEHGTQRQGSWSSSSSSSSSSSYDDRERGSPEHGTPRRPSQSGWSTTSSGGSSQRGSQGQGPSSVSSSQRGSQGQGSSSVSSSQSAQRQSYGSRQEYGQGQRTSGSTSSGSSEEQRQRGGGTSTSGGDRNRYGGYSYGRNQQTWSSSSGTSDGAQKQTRPGGYQHGFSWNSVSSSQNNNDNSAYPDHVVIGGSGRRGSSWVTTSSRSQSMDERRFGQGGNRNVQGQGDNSGVQGRVDGNNRNQGSSWSSSSSSTSSQRRFGLDQSGSSQGGQGQPSSPARIPYGNNMGSTTYQQGGSSYTFGNRGQGSSQTQRPGDLSQKNYAGNTQSSSWTSSSTHKVDNDRRFGYGGSSQAGSSSQGGDGGQEGHIHGKYEEGSYWNSDLRGKSQRGEGHSSSGYDGFDSQGNGGIPKSYEWHPSSEDGFEVGGYNSIQYGGNQQGGNYGGGQMGSGVGGGQQGGNFGGGFIGGGQQGGYQGGGGVGSSGSGGGQQGVTWTSSSSSNAQPGSNGDYGNGTIWTRTYSYSSNSGDNMGMSPNQQGGFQGRFQNGSSWSRTYSYSSNVTGNKIFGPQLPGMQQGVFANGSSYVMIDPNQLGIQGFGGDGRGLNFVNGSSWVNSGDNKNLIYGPSQKGGTYGYSYQYSSSHSSSSSNPYTNFSRDNKMTPINNQHYGVVHKIGSDDQDPRGVSGKK